MNIVQMAGLIDRTFDQLKTTQVRSYHILTQHTTSSCIRIRVHIAPAYTSAVIRELTLGFKQFNPLNFTDTVPYQFAIVKKTDSQTGKFINYRIAKVSVLEFYIYPPSIEATPFVLTKDYTVSADNTVETYTVCWDGVSDISKMKLTNK